MKTRIIASVFLFCLALPLGLFADVSNYISSGKAATTKMGGNAAQPVADLFSGAFNYGIPIGTPPGRNKIQPDLNLVYNSRVGNGPTGNGWSLPIASITRSLRYGIPRYDDDDIFEYSGQELVNTSGSTYRLFIESSFMKFVLDGNTWYAYDTNGTEYTFSAKTGRDTSDFDDTFQWCLTRVEDVFGNYMTFDYTVPSGENFAYIDEIKYTGHMNGETTIDHQPDYSVQFGYAARYDKILLYSMGFKMYIDERLSTIDVKYGSTLIRKYWLTYVYSDDSGRSLLTEVQVSSDSAGNITLPPIVLDYHTTDSDEKGWNYDGNWESPIAFTKEFQCWFWDYEYGYWKDEYFSSDLGVRLIDVNGDGLVEIVKACEDCGSYYGYGAEYEVYENLGERWSNTINTQWTNALSSALSSDEGAFVKLDKRETFCQENRYPYGFNNIHIGVDWGLRAADVNGDGLMDFMLGRNDSGGNKRRLYIHDANTVSWTAVDDLKFDFIDVFESGGDYEVTDNGIRLGELNGDGWIDFASAEWSNGCPTHAVFHRPAIYYYQWRPIVAPEQDEYLLYGSNRWYYTKETTEDWKNCGWDYIDFDYNWPTYDAQYCVTGETCLVDFLFIHHDEVDNYDMGLRLIDINGDGLSDLYNTGSQGWPSNWYSHSYNGYDDWDAYPGYEAPLDLQGATDMGIRLFDVNNDGLFDMV